MLNYIHTRFGFDESVFGFHGFLKTSFESIYYICFEYRVLFSVLIMHILAISSSCFRTHGFVFQRVFEKFLHRISLYPIRLT
jgi:hypothetical protein